VFRVVKEITEIFFRNHVAISAASLSYYLTLSIFPFLICANVILGSLNIQETDAFALLDGILPEGAFSTISDYLNYISGSRSELMFVVGLTAMLTSSSAAFRSFTVIMGEIQGKMRFTGIRGWLISFIFSIVFLAVIYGSALIIISGEWLMQMLERPFDIKEITDIWNWIRFVILFLLLFTVIYGMYIISAPKQTKRTSRLPGALAASVILVIASMIFSRLITVSISYELLYGSLASFIILMVWLYTCAFILIMANVLNISVGNTKRTKKEN